MKFSKLWILSLGLVTPVTFLPLCSLYVNNNSYNRISNAKRIWSWDQNFTISNPDQVLYKDNGGSCEAFVHSMNFHFEIPVPIFLPTENVSNIRINTISNAIVTFNNFEGAYWSYTETGSEQGPWSFPTDRPSVSCQFYYFPNYQTVTFHRTADISNFIQNWVDHCFADYVVSTNTLNCHFDSNLQFTEHFTKDGNNETKDLNYGSLNPGTISNYHIDDYYLDSTSFDKNKLVVPDYDKSFYSATQENIKSSDNVIAGYIKNGDERSFQFSFPIYYKLNNTFSGLKGTYIELPTSKDGWKVNYSEHVDEPLPGEYYYTETTTTDYYGVSNIWENASLAYDGTDYIFTFNTSSYYAAHWSGQSTNWDYPPPPPEPEYPTPQLYSSTTPFTKSIDPSNIEFTSFPQGMDISAFDKDKLLIPDIDDSFYDESRSYLTLKLNEDYVSADLMGWDTTKNQVSGKKDPTTGNYDNSFWIQQPDIAQFAKILPQWALNDLSNAIIDGKLIDCDVSSGIFDWTIPTTTTKPLEWYDNTEQSWSLSNFLINHAHDDQTTMEAAIADLSILKWKNDYVSQHIDITSALQFDNYLDVVTNLLSQNLNYTLTYIDGADQTQPQTKTFNLNDLMGGEIALSFNYPSIDNTWFQLQSCITNDGAFGTLGTSDTLGIYDIANDKVWSLNGDSSNYWQFSPSAFTLSNALDEIDGNPLDKNAGFFYGPTGLGTNPTAWSAFTKILYTKTPSQIKAYLDAEQVPASDTQGLGDVPFDKTCFVQVKEAFETSYTIDQLIDHVDYVCNDNTGTLQMTIHFKDEASGDAAQVLNVQLFAKNVILQKHSRSTPIKIEPSQINQQYILDNLIAYNGITVGDDDSYLFETNLSKTEFAQALKGVIFKVQNDDSGKLDVVFNLYSTVYNMNPSGMPVPDLQSIEIIDNDFTPLHPHSGTNLTALWVVLGIVGFGIMLIFIIKFAKRGKKYNSAYDDEEVQDELNQRKIEAKKSGKKFIEENKTEIKIDKPIKKSVLHKFKKDTKVNSEKEPSITKSVIDEDEEALKG